MTRVVDTFFELVQVDAPSKQEKPMAELLVQKLEALGLSVEIDDSAKETGSNTGNVLARLKGTGKGEVVLSAHMDAVDPCIGIKPVLGEDGIIRSEGDTILSSDDRSGIASILEALARIQEQDEKVYPDILVTFTVQEEVGLVGAKYLDESLFKNNPLALVADGDEAPGGISIAAPFHHTFKATFTGKAAHAGAAPEKGISAIKMAADAIARLDWGRLDEESSANIGTIKGGSADNVVPKEVLVTGECRSLVKEKVEKIHFDIQESFERAALEAGGQVVMDWDREYEGYKLDEESDTVKLLKAAAQDAKLEPMTSRSGGGSDANILAGKGANPVVLGTGMSNFHTTDEYIKAEDLQKTAEFIEAILYRVAQEH
ncbi:MAG: M20/M25/M40 family metallo-hydrolase [Coriobacteriia bacterium]|nr:M20/M25/M40 family metallo-hydrolase [Coriobacteriia bacterium]